MDTKQINEILDNYNKLIILADDKIGIMGEADIQYSTLKGIEEIDFVGDEVWVKCDDSYRGCADSHYFSFPISFLSTPDDELKETVIRTKELRIEAEKRAKDDAEQKRKEAQERAEFERYNELKVKFESK